MEGRKEFKEGRERKTVLQLCQLFWFLMTTLHTSNSLMKFIHEVKECKQKTSGERR